MDLKKSLAGKKALITGGSKGIGLAIKIALESCGVEVISWSRSEGVDLADAYHERPDLPDIDFLINNVGGGGTWVCSELDQIDINYDPMWVLTRDFLAQKKEFGRVITISSIFGKEKGHNPGFTATKAAQIAYMKCLAGTVNGTTFNTICPGHLDVGKPFPDDPKIIGKPEDVANLVAFLCSDFASHINGACITVDGGASHSF